MSYEDIRENFEMLDEWEDRYRYLIELGRALPPLEPALKTDATKVRGCASQVWLIARETADDATTSPAPTLTFQGESDAHIVQGLIAVLLAIHSGNNAETILATDTHAQFNALGLSDHLTPQRSNGLKAMIERIRAEAAARVQ
ncbi:MAG: SufE family protein [Pseudomonadota bacterium]